MTNAQEISPPRSWLALLLAAPPEAQERVVRSLTPAQLQELELATRWLPQPGRQTEAYDSPADILGYGGAAGGGKTDLALGLAGTRHQRSVVFRREYPRLKGIIDRSKQLFEACGDYNASDHVWTLRDARSIRFGSLQYEDDKRAWQGQPHDLYVFDELPEFSESQFRYVTGWNRTTVVTQRCRIVGTFNPPTDSDGEWVTEFFGPWLKENHPHPAKPGELRWYMPDQAGKDVEMPNGDPVPITGPDGTVILVRPISRTFIPARLADNPALARTNYWATLNAMPEPLRSQMLYGDFKVGREDNAYQVIPSEWVRLAQERWKARPRPTARMDAMGVDVARGGKDKTTIAPRHGNWFDELKAYPGKSTPDGPAVATLVIQHRKDNATVNIDVIAVGTSPYDCLKETLGDRAVPMNAAAGSDKKDKSNQLGFKNQRAEWWWGMREALDPANGEDLALPPDPELKADLCAPRWKLTAQGIQVESKEDIAKRIGRSTDRADAVVMAHAIKYVPGMGLLDYMREQQAAKAVQTSGPESVPRGP